MVILALETATRAGSVAMLDDARHHARIGAPTRTHSERLPAELLEFPAEHGRRFEEVEYLAVVTGPGSFTGLRIGIAAVQGISMVTGKPVIPVPTLDAMARASAENDPSRRTRLLTCLDGARGDVFFAVFDLTEDGRGEPSVVVAPAVGSPLEAARRVSSLSHDTPLRMIGDGVRRYREVFAGELPDATFDDQSWNLALGAALLASSRTAHASAPHALRPLYVRRPDAVLARERLRASGEDAALEIVRATTPEDLAAVADLQRRSFANAWGAEAIRWELDNSSVARLYAARTDRGGVVAYCACWLVFDELHINSLAVDHALRRRGLARRVMDHVLRDAVLCGARGATLEVRQSNDAARSLYEGLGFRVEGVRRNYYQNPREDGLILWHRDLASRFDPSR